MWAPKWPLFLACLCVWSHMCTLHVVYIKTLSRQYTFIMEHVNCSVQNARDKLTRWQRVLWVLCQEPLLGRWATQIPTQVWEATLEFYPSGRHIVDNIWDPRTSMWISLGLWGLLVSHVHLMYCYKIATVFFLGISSELIVFCKIYIYIYIEICFWSMSRPSLQQPHFQLFYQRIALI